MANLIIKPQNTSGDKVIKQDQAGNPVLTTADSGATLGNSTQDNITRLGTVTSGSIAGGTITNATTFPSGHILSVSHVQPTSGGTSTTNNTYIDCPGLTLTKTPASSSSKFLILYNLHFYIDSHSNNAWRRAFWAVHRSISGGSSGLVHTPMDSDTGSYGFADFKVGDSDRIMAFQPGHWLDSPNTASAVTYKCQFKSPVGYSIYNNTDYGHSSMTLMEISS